MKHSHRELMVKDLLVLPVRGYVGNGQPDASDFQAGTILDTASSISPEDIEEL